MPAKVRLNKFLRDCYQGSRRKCEDLIRGGLVTIDGEQVTELATLVDPECQRVEVSGKPVTPFSDMIYIAANKPRGIVVTASDPRGRKTIYDGIGNLPAGIFSVGRLDMDSEGLVILTNDGKLAFRLAHPRYGVERVYEVQVKGKIGRDLVGGLTKGVLLEEGVARAKRVELLKQGQERGTLSLTLTEGKKREVRRMVAGCGYEVLRLKRVRFGNIALGRLRGGSWRNLVRDEVRGLRRLVQEAYDKSRSDD